MTKTPERRSSSGWSVST